MNKIAAIVFIACVVNPATFDANSYAQDLPGQAGVERVEFVFDAAPFEECHASTLCETEDSLVVAWFGGKREGDPSVGIWMARREGQGWSAPAEIANGVQPPGRRYACWNPVLFQVKGRPLLLFYKVGPSPQSWWGMMKISEDGGRTWSQPRRLPEGILGPIKNKPIELANGGLLCPSSTEDKKAGWRVHFELTEDWGRSWRRTGPVNRRENFDAIQPTLLTYPDGCIQALCRSRQGKITEVWSKDGGRSWGPMVETLLPNPNSGIDGVTLSDERQLLVYNHTTVSSDKWAGPRSPLNVAVSGDGRAWKAALVLEDEPGRFSYPAVIQTSDGMVHVTYTWRRETIKHVILNPSKLVLRNMPDGRWPDAPAGALAPTDRPW